MKFFALTAFLALAVAIVAADVATVKADIAALDAAATALNTKLASNSINYYTALSIHSSAQSLDTKIKAATTDVKANTQTVTDADAVSLIKSLTVTETTAKSLTDRLVVLKAKFDSLGVTNMAKQDIAALKADIGVFGSALVAAATAAQRANAQALANKFNADLQAAATVYGV